MARHRSQVAGPRSHRFAMPQPTPAPRAKPYRAWVLGPLLSALCALLAACGGGEANYHLTSLLPSPVTPGDTVTAYGSFPANAVLSLGARVLPTTAVAGGLRFSLPADQVAGDQPLRISGSGASLSGAVQVLPRIDNASLSGTRLSLTGAGWPPDLRATTVLLDATALTPTLVGSALQVSLPPVSAYGVVSLVLQVGGAASAPYNLLRQAGTVQGSVTLPAAPATFGLTPPGQGTGGMAPGLARLFPSSQLPSNHPKTLLVHHSKGALETPHLRGLLRQDDLPRLGVSRLVFASPEAASAARALLQSLPGVALVETDALAKPQGSRAIIVPPPPGWRSSPGISIQSVPPYPKEQWHLPLMGLPQAWSKTQGAGVTVAVVDTGVLLTHPDLQGNLLPGWNFVEGNATPNDTYGHGTHVAGLIAASGKVLGAAPQAKLLPVRVLNGEAGGSSFVVAQGILWAAGLLNDSSCTSSSWPSATCNPHKAQVINLSLGVDGSDSTLGAAVSQALKVGVVVVAAAGNSGGPLAFPASMAGVISVTAVAGPQALYQPFYASHGPGLELSAYGGDTTTDQDGNGVPDGILSTDRDAQGNPSYGLRMGTSMAAPLVSGLAALALSSGTPASLVRQTLEGTATDLGVMGYDPQFGYGLGVGRTATASSPRTYVGALDASSKVLAWTLVQPDGSFLLGNLPPGETLSLFAASDADGNGVVGEAGELLSTFRSFTPTAGQVSSLAPFTLNPSDGSKPIKLP